MKTSNKRISPQELKRRNKVGTYARLEEWKKTREGKRQYKNK